jgi:formylglycine-generating enzyme required for sulfatase activity
MGKYPVTQGEYLAVMGSNPSYFRNGTANCAKSFVTREGGEKSAK